MELCGAKARGGGLCQNGAGKGTDHYGEGRCKWHGGSNPIKHGRYSKIPRRSLGQLFEDYDNDTDLRDLYGEVAMLRAMVHNYVERYDEFSDALIAWHASYESENATPKPRMILDITDAARLVDQVGKMVKRIEDIEANSALSLKDFERLLLAMKETVRARTDGDTSAKIFVDWANLQGLR